jgi:hypothetical protein
MNLTITRNGNGKKARPDADRLESLSPGAEPVEASVTVRDGAEVALECLRRGMSEERILSVLRREHGMRPTQAANWLERAYETLRGLHERRAPIAKLARAVEQREHIVEKALANNDYRIALSAIESRDKILGLGDSDLTAEDQAARSLLQLAELARNSANMTDEGLSP